MLFLGDTIITESNGNANYSSKSMSYDLELTKKSFETRLKDLDFEVMLPGHRPAITSGASAKVKELIARST